MLNLKLYIARKSEKQDEMIQNLRAYFETNYGEVCISVINVLEDPGAALSDEVVATPTLIKITPEPQCRIFGDFSRDSTLSAALDLFRQ